MGGGFGQADETVEEVEVTGDEGQVGVGFLWWVAGVV